MTVDYFHLDAPELQSGNNSDSDYFSELNSAKSIRMGQRSSSLPLRKANTGSVSDIVYMEPPQFGSFLDETTHHQVNILIL